MSRYIALRILHSFVVVIGVVTAVFILLRLSGDPIRLLVPPDATPEHVERIKEIYGLNDPIHIQYVTYIARALTGDLGTSLRYNLPALSLVLDRLPATLLLAAASLMVAIILAIPLGIVAAIKRGSIYDTTINGIAALGQSIPPFWLGMMLIILLSVNFRLFPTSGHGTPMHLVLPVVTLAAYTMARLVKLTRSSMLEVLSSDYVRTARGKGLPETAVIFLHALKNALSSILTLSSLQFSDLLGGAIVIELLFAWPGIGRLMVEAVFARDYPIAQAAVLVIALLVTATSLITDILYTYVDPRVRLT